MLRMTSVVIILERVDSFVIVCERIEVAKVELTTTSTLSHTIVFCVTHNEDITFHTYFGHFSRPGEALFNSE